MYSSKYIDESPNGQLIKIRFTKSMNKMVAEITKSGLLTS